MNWIEVETNTRSIYMYNKAPSAGRLLIKRTMFQLPIVSYLDQTTRVGIEMLNDSDVQPALHTPEHITHIKVDSSLSEIL